jgi:hypothetical protein
VAAALPSRRKAFDTARDRFADGRRFCERDALAVAVFAARFVRALPVFGAGTLTPARRAFDRPIATACLAERAPCFPSRMWCTSSRTNSPA